MKSKVKRLAENFNPVLYELELNFAKDSDRFSGRVIIHGKKIGRPSFRLVFHQKDLQIKSGRITKIEKSGKKVIEVIRINRHKSFDEVRLHTKERLTPGDYIVELEFTGRILEKMHGVYPCTFDLNGKKQQIISTQLEPHHAREVFPCIDEPVAKAQFHLTLHTPGEQVVLSNTPIESQTKEASCQKTVFATTPIMSTYLLAFLFGDLKFKESKTSSGITVRTYATPDKADQTDFALGVAVKTLEYFEKYFEIKFPLPKCDFVALPDFSAGAMENWGLITFRETTLLVDPKNTALDVKQYVALVVAHELAHQWFGNLVTMNWWTDLWLNEGFASWIEYMAIDKLFPEWRMWDQFVANEYIGAMNLDSLENTHPIEVEVPDPDEIRSIFDSISYNKGASVIRMLHAFLGQDDFRRGLVSYLKKHQYGNTVTQDLWAALEQVSKKPVKDFMSAWTSQPGFPVLHLKQTKDELELRQSRYYINPNTNRGPDPNWPIAIELDGQMHLLDQKTTKLQAPKDIAQLNPRRTGFFMLDYDNVLNDIKKHLSALDPLERLGLLHDTFQLAKSGDNDTKNALDLISDYDQEDNLVVWQAISAQISSLVRVFEDSEIRRGLRKLTNNLIEAQIKRLGWKVDAKDTHFDLLLRPMILGLGVFGRRKDVVDKAVQWFETARNLQDIDADLRPVVLSATARHEPQSFERIFEWYKESRSAEDRDTLAGALTTFKQPDHVRRALDLIRTENVRLQDVPHWLVGLFSNRHAKAAAWDWLRANWDWIEDKFGSETVIGQLPIMVGRSFSDETKLKEYDEFFLSIKTPGIARGIAQGQETVQWQSAWRQRDEAAVKQWLDKYQKIKK